MDHQTSAWLMLLATFLMIAAPVAFPLAAYWSCTRLKAHAESDVAIAFLAGIAVAVVCFKFAQRLASELA